MLTVAHNLGAMNAQRQFNITGATIKKSMEKLSSGYRINRAADDAAGLTISEKMRSLIRGMNQGSDNIQDGISVMQIADGALAEVHGMLHRMTELSIKAANGTNTAADRAAIQAEINELSSEITRIGKSTEFNTMPILDDAFGEEVEGKITKLVSCPSAENLVNGRAYLSEYVEYPQESGKYYSSATMDFSGVNSRNIKKLNGAGFSFTCSDGCNEVFEFEFMTDGRRSYVDGQNNGRQKHFYHVDISQCTSGKEVVNTLYDYVNSFKPNGGYSSSLPGLAVSHSNNMMKTADGNGLTILENWKVFNTKEEAMTYYVNRNTKYGVIECSSLTNIVSEDIVNSFRIQCSNIVDDCEYIETYRMNAKVLGVDTVNVETQEDAQRAIKKIEDALAIVSEHRSAYGAFQNRLEHSYANNQNKAENMTAAESQIRDTDMAKEMVSFTTANILSQAGSAMISQAMQNPQSVLQLLS